MATVTLPIRVTGMDEFRAAIAEIKAGAVDLKALGATINVSIHINDPIDFDLLALEVTRRQHLALRTGSLR